MTITIAIVDPHDLVRLGIEHYLSHQPYLHLHGSFATLDAFCRSPGAQDVEVLLVDDTLPHLMVGQAVHQVADHGEQVRVILLVSRLTPHALRAALKAGFAGIVCKQEIQHDHVLRGICQTGAEDMYLSPQVALMFAQQDEQLSLTPRLRQVLALLEMGYHVQEIAHRLVISSQAVYSIRTRLREALGVDTNEQIISEARRRGLLDEG